MQVFVKLFLFVALTAILNANAYEHKDQAAWYDLDAECHLDRQSPIELNSRESFTGFGIPTIDFNNFEVLHMKPTPITNNGHSADLQLSKDNHASISGGPFQDDVYVSESIHFHWGSENHHGSEHVVDSHRYSMEMHIVHRNNKYSSVAEATGHADGLAVLGIFFEVDPNQQNDFEGLNNIVDSLDAIEEYSTSSKVDFLRLSNLLEGIDTDEFFTYQGSLTTPPCSRAVTWIVFPEPIKISENQINRFRSLKDNHNEAMVNNYRFLQAKGSRQVYLRPSFF